MSTGIVARYEGIGGVRVYRIQARVFPPMTGNIYVVVVGNYVALVDTGSGLGQSNEHLLGGMASLRSEWGERVGWANLKRIIITHAHIDHFGGLSAARTMSAAPISAHEFDRRVLSHYSERLALTSRSLSEFLWRAGVSQTEHAELMELYGWNKGLFQSVEVATPLHDGDLLDGVFRVHHVPGHCPGQICLQVGDILLSADQVLSRTSPHIAPESIMPSTGLDHYLQSLRKVAALPGIRIALGGHEEPIEDLPDRAEQIAASHQRKLDRVCAACAEPRTIADLSKAIHPNVQGYDLLLAIEEVGAHVEYLDQRGELTIANIDAVAQDERVAPRYRCV